MVGLSSAQAELVGRGAQFGPDTMVRHLVGIDPGRAGVAVGELVFFPGVVQRLGDGGEEFDDSLEAQTRSAFSLQDGVQVSTSICRGFQVFHFDEGQACDGAFSPAVHAHDVGVAQFPGVLCFFDEFLFVPLNVLQFCGQELEGDCMGRAAGLALAPGRAEIGGFPDRAHAEIGRAHV